MEKDKDKKKQIDNEFRNLGVSSFFNKENMILDKLYFIQNSLNILKIQNLKLTWNLIIIIIQLGMLILAIAIYTVPIAIIIGMVLGTIGSLIMKSFVEKRLQKKAAEDYKAFEEQLVNTKTCKEDSR